LSTYFQLFFDLNQGFAGFNYLAIVQQFSPNVLCIVLHNKIDFK